MAVAAATGAATATAVDVGTGKPWRWLHGGTDDIATDSMSDADADDDAHETQAQESDFDREQYASSSHGDILLDDGTWLETLRLAIGEGRKDGAEHSVAVVSDTHGEPDNATNLVGEGLLEPVWLPDREDDNEEDYPDNESEGSDELSMEGSAVEDVASVQGCDECDPPSDTLPPVTS